MNGTVLRLQPPGIDTQAVKLFGVLALLSFGAAYYFYAIWFISVWCFFAALLSMVIYLHFLARAPLLKEASS